MKKFGSDLKRAKEANSDLENFLFVTNVNLTRTQKQKLIVRAKQDGIHFCDIYDRERIRIVLGSIQA